MVSDPSQRASQTGEQRYRHLFEHAPICIFVVDLTLRPATILEINRRAELFFGYAAAEMVRMPFARLVSPEAAPVILHIVTQVGQGLPVKVDTVSQHRDGTGVAVRIIASLDPSDAGRMIVIMQDIGAEIERRSETEAIAAERRRIAHEIHDGVAQSLAGLRFKSASWPSLAAGDPTRLRVAVDELQHVLNDAITDLRRAIFALRPLDLETLGFLPALTHLVGDFGDYNQVAARLELSDPQIVLPAVYELPLFRIIQEGLSNAGQHARATLVLVSLSVDGAGGVQTCVRDDGCGFDPRQLGPVDRDGHFGLRQMRERILDLGGTLDIHSAPGRGTELIITLPPCSKEATLGAD